MFRRIFLVAGFLISGLAFAYGLLASVANWIEWALRGGHFPDFMTELNWVLTQYAWGLTLAGGFTLGLMLRLSRIRRVAPWAIGLTAILLVQGIAGLIIQSSIYEPAETAGKLTFVAGMTAALLAAILPSSSIWLDWPRRSGRRP